MQNDTSGQASNPVDESSTPINDGMSPFVSFYQPPRLSIAHLLIWMAAAAVLMSITISIDRWTRDSAWSKLAESSEGAFSLVILIVGRILLAAGLVGMVIVIRDRIRRVSGSLQPGHWIILASCTGRISQILIQLILAPFLSISNASTGSSALNMALMATPFLAITLVVAVINLLAAKRCPAGRLWRSTFWMWSIITVLGVVMGGLVLMGISWSTHELGYTLFLLLAMGPVFLLSIASAVTFCIAVVRDLRNKERRDWIHWLGVAMVVSKFVLGLLSWGWHMVTVI